jgi:heme-degrading monooxygenase HmoA
MVYPLIRINVADYEQWRPVFDSAAPARRAGGSRGGQLFRSGDSPNEVMILWEWEDLASAQQFFQSAELREAMQRAGVTSRPEVVFLEEVEYVTV